MSKTTSSNGSKLASFRKVNALSRRELGNLVGKSSSSIYHYEKENTVIPSDVVDFLNTKFDLGLTKKSSSDVVYTVETFKNGKTKNIKSKELGKTIQAFRHSKNMTAYNLASKLGVAEQTVKNYESGSNSIPTSIISQLNKMYKLGINLSSSSRTSKETKVSKVSSKKNTSFGDRLKSIRTSKNMTQKQFGKKYFMTTSHVCNLERNRASYLNIATVKSLINDGIDVSKLVGASK